MASDAMQSNGAVGFSSLGTTKSVVLSSGTSHPVTWWQLRKKDVMISSHYLIKIKVRK
jgi:hypothetical protein